MTSKKRRQRGSRTHGGGSQKNRRGAGHRGGRGDAGRTKHEQLIHDPIGKSGFTRPEKVTDDVAEVSLQKLDEDAALLAADGLAEATEGGFRIDAREIADDDEADVVKVLGTGQVRRELDVVADAFSDGAEAAIEDAGGTAELTELGQNRQTEDDGESDE